MKTKFLFLAAAAFWKEMYKYVSFVYDALIFVETVHCFIFFITH